MWEKSILLWKFYLCSENSYVHEIHGTHGGQFHIVDFFLYRFMFSIKDFLYIYFTLYEIAGC